MKKLKVLATLLLLSHGVRVLANTETLLWANAENAFALLEQMDSEIIASEKKFAALISDCEALQKNFSSNELQRQNAFAQMQDRVHALTDSLQEARATQAQAEGVAVAEQIDLNNQISVAVNHRQEIIDSLVTTKTALQDEIKHLQQNLATLQDMNDSKAAELQAELDQTVTHYEQMLATRQAFLDVLDQTLLRAQAYEYTTESDLAALNIPAPTTN